MKKLVSIDLESGENLLDTKYAELLYDRITRSEDYFQGELLRAELIAQIRNVGII